MFDPSTVDLEEDPDFYEDVEEDVAQECARYGTVLGYVHSNSKLEQVFLLTS